ncbi:MAG: hypothetical protein IJY42_03690 [Clostridia bacterium]|nr:hypothetical protein [Clostridia bacterium]
MKVIHNITLDISAQGVQAIVPITQNDVGTHQLCVRLQNGSEAITFSQREHAVLHVPDGDIWDPVTVYTEQGAYPNRLIYHVSAAVSAQSGMRTAIFQILNEEGGLLYSPEVVFSVRTDLTLGSVVASSAPYAAVIQAQTAAEEAARSAETAMEAAEEALAETEAALTKVGDFAGTSALQTEANTLCGAINELHREAEQDRETFRHADAILEARVMNLEAASDGRLYTSATLTGSSVSLPDGEELLPQLMITKIGDLSNAMDEQESYSFPVTIGPLSLPLEWEEGYGSLCRGRSYFDLVQGKHVQYTDQTYTFTGEESTWCEPNGDTWSYYVTIPELSDLEPGISLSLTGDAASYLLSAPIHESDGNVYFPIVFENYEALEACLPGSVLTYGTGTYIETPLELTWEPYIALSDVADGSISSDNGVEFELTYLTRCQSETDYLMLSEVSF